MCATCGCSETHVHDGAAHHAHGHHGHHGHDHAHDHDHDGGASHADGSRDPRMLRLEHDVLAKNDAVAARTRVARDTRRPRAEPGERAERRFAVGGMETREPDACISGKIPRGPRKPHDCPAFGTICTPDHPLGATMVSAEGACAAYDAYGRRRAVVTEAVA